MRTWFATPEDKQGTYSALKASSDNPGRNLQQTSAFLATVAVFWRQLETGW
jgi:hypothetical protein